jgi:hypothetical protein
MEYHNNYLEYMVQKDKWYVVFLNRYSEAREHFCPTFSFNQKVSHKNQLFRVFGS